MAHSLFDSLQTFNISGNRTGRLYSLPELERQGVAQISKLPISIRIVLESVLRNYDGQRITEENVRRLANWEPNHLNAPKKSRSLSRASCFRISPASRFWSIWRRCVRPPREWAKARR